MRRQRPNPLPSDGGGVDEFGGIERKKIRLLVIDDQPSYCALVREQVELCSFKYEIECEFTDSSERASELMRGWSPTVILVDAHLPSIDCLQFLERWGEGGSSIIVTSDSCSREIEGSVLARGADLYLPKSENPEELERLIDTIGLLATGVPELH